MAQWTEEQLAAIEARGASFLVAAAAGSGKTSVLVERLIRILSDTDNRVDITRLAVVTFTNDAAAEMRGRLEQALAARIAAEPENAWLRRQHALLRCAKISTIHSFCYALIRDYGAQLDISPSFRILEENEEVVLRDAAMAQTLEQWYADPSRRGAMALLCDTFCGKTDSRLAELLLSLYRQAAGMPFGIERLTALEKGYADGSMRERFLAQLRDRLTRAEEWMAKAEQAVADVAQPKLTEHIQGEHTQAMLLRRAAEDASCTPTQLADLLARVEFARIPPMGKKCLAPERYAYVRFMREESKKILKALHDDMPVLLRHMDEDLALHHAVFPHLRALLADFSAALWAKKCEKNAIGFDDGEQLALALLGSWEGGRVVRTPLAQALSEQYQMLLLDEFQDTNNRQDLIFKLLSHGGSAERNGDNLFMVGDVKQAIYRFRLANPQNFLDTMAASVPYSPDTTENAFLRLNRNFRSSPEVVQTVNFVFRAVMSPAVGEVCYDAGEELVQGAAFADTPRATEVMLLSDKAQEADYIAARIAGMLRDGAAVSVNGTQTRPCRPRDFCILCRTRDPMAGYAAALEERGVAVYCEEESAYLKAREIALLLHLLRVIDNPPNDISMAAVLLSPMFSFTADDLVELRILARYTSLYSAICLGIGKQLESAQALPQMTGALLDKAEYFYNTLQSLRMYAVSDTLEQLIRRIYDSTDFLAVMRRGTHGSRRQANLRMLLAHARGYETNTGGGLGGFLRYIDCISALGKDMQEGAVVSGSEDVVTVKTIHGSKGLEFPFVFLADSARVFSVKEKSAPYQFAQSLGFGFRMQTPAAFERFVTMPYALILTHNESLSKSESMRLLYVALTRAKDRLFLPLCCDGASCKRFAGFADGIAANGAVTPELAAAAGSMADWLAMAFLSAENGTLLRTVCGATDCACAGGVPVAMDEYKPQEKQATEAAEETSPFLPDAAATALLRERFAACRARVPDTRFAKTTVSMLTREDEAIDLALRRPRFLEAAGKLTPAEKGTALHAFLQFADFAAAQRDPAAEIARLTAQGYLSAAQADSIRVPWLTRFFESDLYLRICASSRVSRERRFLVRLRDLELPELTQFSDTDAMLSGIMDLVFEEPDGLVLVDYKTDAVSAAEVLTERHHAQLQVYARTLTLIEQKPVKAAYLYAFSLGQMVPVALT